MWAWPPERNFRFWHQRNDGIAGQSTWQCHAGIVWEAREGVVRMGLSTGGQLIVELQHEAGRWWWWWWMCVCRGG